MDGKPNDRPRLGSNEQPSKQLEHQKPSSPLGRVTRSCSISLSVNRHAYVFCFRVVGKSKKNGTRSRMEGVVRVLRACLCEGMGGIKGMWVWTKERTRPFL